MVVAIEGDIGDTIFALGVIQGIPHGPHTLVLKTSGMTKIRTGADLERYHGIVAPLADIQPYIAECRLHRQGEHVDWDSGGFRGTGMWCPEVTLLGAHAYHLQSSKGIKVPHGTARWIHHVTPSPEAAGRIVINRTGRYRNPHFPWPQIVNHYGDRLLFIGLPHEYRDFCGEFGMVEFHRTSNMLEVSELILGSVLFIGNQSSANACAEGLKHPLIQETCLHIPDCIFKRPNAQHVATGGCLLPDVSGSGSLEIPHQRQKSFVFRTHMTPPDGWHFGPLRQLAWNAMLSEAMRRIPREFPQLIGKTEQEVATLIMEENWDRVPHFFADDSYRHLFRTFDRAMETATTA